MLILWSKHSTAEAFVSAVLQFCPHSFIMPRKEEKEKKKKTPQEVKQIIDQLTQENEKDIKNKELNINFKKYENARIKLEAFQRTLDSYRFREYSAISI